MPQLQSDAEFADPPSGNNDLRRREADREDRTRMEHRPPRGHHKAEKAPTQTAFVRGEAVVEPMTNYAVVRLQRDIGRRAGVGMLATTVNRRITCRQRDTSR